MTALSGPGRPPTPRASMWARRASSGQPRSGSWLSRPGSAPASRCSTCAAVWPARPADRGGVGMRLPGCRSLRQRTGHRRRRAGNLPCRFEQAHLPPLPEGRFEVVFLLETMLAFPDKAALIGEVARVLEPGGRFACAVEEEQAAHRAGKGTDARRRYGLARRAGGIDLRAAQRGAGRRSGGRSTAPHITRQRRRCFAVTSAKSPQIARQIGKEATAELITAHQLWSDWLGSGRVRKFAMVAENDDSLR